jgi:opacity protein-like surface antigen
MSPAVAGAFTYMFTNAVGLGVEVTWVPTLTPELPMVPDLFPATGSSGAAIFPPIPILPTLSYSDTGGRAVIMSTNLRLAVPTRSSRFTPYVMAGGGVATIKEEWTATLSLPDVVIQSFGDLAAFGSTTFPFYSMFNPISVPVSRTFTSLALTAGGGVSINLNRQWSADVDLRYLALLGSRDLHVGRYGGGVSYKF